MISGRQLLTGLLGATLLGVGGTAILASPASAADAEVVRVVDGDTVDIRIDGEVTRIRLLNVDAPETVNPSEPVECLGPEASNLLHELLPAGSRVSLKYDAERKDRYGRDLAAVFRDGKFVNGQLAAAGVAVPITVGRNSLFRPEVDAAFAQAARARVGFFSPAEQCTVPAQTAALEQTLASLTPDSELTSPEQAAAVASQAGLVVAAIASLETGLREGKAIEVRAIAVSSWQSTLAAISRVRTTAEHAQATAINRGSEIRAARIAEAKARAEAAARAKAKSDAVARARAMAKAKAEAAARARAAQLRARAASTVPRRTPRASTTPSSSSTGGGGLSGYTGCRRYAPGGKTWVPIPCP